MFKKNSIVWLILLTFNTINFNFVAAQEPAITSETINKYNLSICAIFKNEARNLKDWIDYHRKIGVDHFYLYNTGSRDQYFPILIPYMNEGLVTLVNWPSSIRLDEADDYLHALSTQVSAYENAVNFVAKEETKWLILINIDEHLACPNGNLSKLLEEYEEFPSILLSSDTYDAENKNPVPLKKIFNQTLEHLNSNTEIVNTSVVKMIFKPDQCNGFIWPPYQCRFKTEQAGIEANPQELRINHFLNKNRNLSRSKHKCNGKHDIAYEAASVELKYLRQETESQYSTMYYYMPEFLKKLKFKQQQAEPM
ncbi:MAG TPA: glycosyltransferase family 92 protein [Parachlamydiaceae bacterium]|nr:glycosyltransferase family 92 protein [Parachlamydiaceae bacterium]